MGAGAGAMSRASIMPQNSPNDSIVDNNNPRAQQRPPEKATSMRQKKMCHLEKTRLTQTVETFTKLIYLNIQSNVSIANFLSNEVGAEVFSRFLEREHADHYVKLYTEVSGYKDAHNHAKMEWTLNKYREVFPRSALASKPASLLPVLRRAELVQEEIIHELAKNMFPRFLCSAEYQKWRSAERSAYSAMFLRGSICCDDEDDDRSTKSGMSGRSQSSMLSLRESSFTSNGREDTSGSNIFNSIELQEMAKIVNSDSWLTTLLARAESLPIGVTLLSAQGDRRGFPLVFVNSFYEERSGFEKSELLGHRWNVLLGTEVDNKTMQVVYRAIKHAKQVKVRIASPRKDGGSASSVMALKPIFDSTGSYIYMLGLHLALEEKSTSEKTEMYLQLADTLTLVLPQVLKQAGDNADD